MITLQDPENVEITSGKLSLSYITIYEITNPKRGTWTLTAPGKNGDHEFSVKTSSDTNVDFEHYFLIALSWRRGHNADVPISNPVTGKSVTFKYHLLTGSEVITGKSETEAKARSMNQGRGLRFPFN